MYNQMSGNTVGFRKLITLTVMVNGKSAEILHPGASKLIKDKHKSSKQKLMSACWTNNCEGGGKNSPTCHHHLRANKFKKTFRTSMPEKLEGNLRRILLAVSGNMSQTTSKQTTKDWVASSCHP